MFAPDLVEVKDKATGKKTYYLYPHSRGWRRVPMVCKGDRPDGPFTPINLTADQRQCVEGSMIDFDPSVFVEPVTDKKDKDFDKGFRAYVFYGFQHSTAAELDQNTMYSVRPGTQIHDYFIPAVTVRCETLRVRNIPPSTRDRIPVSSTSSRPLPSVRSATSTSWSSPATPVPTMAWAAPTLPSAMPTVTLPWVPGVPAVCSLIAAA